MHRLPRLHDGLQVRERGPARRHPDLREVGRGRDVPAGPARVPGDPVQPVRGRAVRGRLPDAGRCTGVTTASSTSTSGSASAARRASPPAPTTRSSSTRRTIRPRSATCARTGSTIGLEPACVTVCPTEAILVGDLNDPDSAVAQIVSREPVTVRRPEKGPGPECSTRARTRRRWIRSPPAAPTAGCSPGRRRAASATRVTSPRPSRPPELQSPRRCCPTTWATTRRGAGGSACTPGPRASPPAACWSPLLLVLAGARLGQPGCPVGGARRGAGLPGLTGLLLIWDLRHPMRFYLIFTRPHWRSWLVRGVVHHRRLRRPPSRCTCSARWPARWCSARWRRGARHPAQPGHRRATPPTCSRRPGPVTCGRARCSARTWPCRRCWPARRRSLPSPPGSAAAGARPPLGAAGAAAAAHVLLARRRDHAGAPHRARAPRGRDDDARPFRSFFWPAWSVAAVAVAAPWIGVVAVRSRCSGCSRTSTPTCRPASRCRSPAHEDLL